MAGYFINASALCTLLNLEDYAGDDTACVYSMLKEFHKTWTTSVQFGGLKAFEKFEVNRGTYWATRPFLQSAKIVEAWGHLLERCATCRTTQDLAETRAAAMQVLTSNAYLTDLLKVVEGRLKAMPFSFTTESCLRAVTPMQAGHTTIEDIKTRLIDLEDVRSYPRDVQGDMTHVKETLHAIRVLYYTSTGKANTKYGQFCEESTVAAHNSLHEVEQHIVRNAKREERILHQRGCANVTIRGIVDGRAGEDLVEIKHRTGKFKPKLNMSDLSQVHAYMFIHRRKTCTLLEAINTGGVLYTKGRVVEWDQEFWGKVCTRVRRLVDVIENLGSNPYFSYSFFTSDGAKQAGMLRHFFSEEAAPVKRKKTKAQSETADEKEQEKSEVDKMFGSYRFKRRRASDDESTAVTSTCNPARN